MSFLSKLTPPYRKGEKNFDRARDAERRRDFDKARDYFQIAASAFDEHFAQNEDNVIQTPHLVMAGIAYTKLGRNEDALTLFERCIERKDIPDVFLHAGYASAKLGDAQRAVDYWSRYPDWADQRTVAAALKEQVEGIRVSDAPDLQTACEAVAEAVFRQDRENASAKLRTRGTRTLPKREY